MTAHWGILHGFTGLLLDIAARIRLKASAGRRIGWLPFNFITGAGVVTGWGQSEFCRATSGLQAGDQQLQAGAGAANLATIGLQTPCKRPAICLQAACKRPVSGR